MKNTLRAFGINFKKTKINLYRYKQIIMRIKKIVIVLAIGFLLRLVVSCCDCNEGAEFKYTFDCMEAFHIDNAGQTSIVVEGGTILKEAYGIQIEFALLQLACNKPFSFSAFNSAYAFKCECPPEIQYLAQDTISSIQIKAINDFDQTHPANSDISDYFKVLDYDNYITLQEFIDAPETMYETKPVKDSVRIFLMQPPVHIGEHRFQVEVLLSNGTILTAETTPINLE